MSSPSDMPQTNPRAMTKQTSSGRYYVHPVTGEEFRSVTTILNAASKVALEKWKLKTVATFAAENREMLAQKSEDEAFDLVRSSQFASSGVAAATGEAVHSRFERLCYVLRDEGESQVAEWMVANPPAPELHHVDSMFLEFLDEFDLRPVHMEPTVLNREFRYAGSADLVAEFRPKSGGSWKRVVADVKSGKSLYGSTSTQCCAYAKGEVILQLDGTEIPMPVIHGTLGIHIRPRSWAVKPLRFDVGVWNVFKSLVVVDQWINFEERQAVGDPLNSGAIERKRSYNARYSQGAQEAA